MERGTAMKMIRQQNSNQTRIARAGWMILLVVSGLLVLNGVAWFFTGPNTSVSILAESIGVTPNEFEASYTQAALGVATTAHMVAIWFMAFGTLALLVALEGYRHGSRWAWHASWVLVAALIAVGILEIGSPFGIALLLLAALTSAGGVMARQGLSQ